MPSKIARSPGLCGTTSIRGEAKNAAIPAIPAIPARWNHNANGPEIAIVVACDYITASGQELRAGGEGRWVFFGAGNESERPPTTYDCPKVDDGTTQATNDSSFAPGVVQSTFACDDGGRRRCSLGCFGLTAPVPMLVAGICLGAALRDFGIAIRTVRFWPIQQELFDWPKIEALAQGMADESGEPNEA